MLIMSVVLDNTQMRICIYNCARICRICICSCDSSGCILVRPHGCGISSSFMESESVAQICIRAFLICIFKSPCRVARRCSNVEIFMLIAVAAPVTKRLQKQLLISCVECPHTLSLCGPDLSAACVAFARAESAGKASSKSNDQKCK